MVVEEWRRRRGSREREEFGIRAKGEQNPVLKHKTKDPTVEIEPTKQTIRSAVDRPVDRASEKRPGPKIHALGLAINYESGRPVRRSGRPVPELIPNF